MVIYRSFIGPNGLHVGIPLNVALFVMYGSNGGRTDGLPVKMPISKELFTNFVSHF